MVVLVSLFTMCIFSGQPVFEGLGYLIPEEQQDTEVIHTGRNCRISWSSFFLKAEASSDIRLS